MKTVFERLYEREINFQVSCFWDGGYDFAIGDAGNGWQATANFETWAEGVQWFEEILATWPSSPVWKPQAARLYWMEGE